MKFSLVEPDTAVAIITEGETRLLLAEYFLAYMYVVHGSTNTTGTSSRYVDMYISRMVFVWRLLLLCTFC